MAILEVQGLTKYFGGLAALNGVDLEVREGEILGLIGPNGRREIHPLQCGRRGLSA